MISEENRSLAFKLVEKNGEFQSLHQHISQSNLQINELRNIQQQILGENEHLKLTISNIEQYCDEMHKRFESVEADYQKKINFLGQDLE